MRTYFLVVVSSTLALASAQAQQAVPIVGLTGPLAKSAETVGAILGVRQLPGNRLLVNDAGRRQVRVFDSTLMRSTVVIDSSAGAGVKNIYGPISAPLIAYPGDSSLFVDVPSQSLLLIDPRGDVVRVVSLPRPSDLFAIVGSRAYADDRGRLVYRARQPMLRAPAQPGKESGFQLADSAPIVRADFDTRVIDTIGRVKMPPASIGQGTTAADGKITMHMVVNPVQVIDDWALLSDGSVAFVRGHDYHVDMLDPSGILRAGNKLAYDWRRLTDDDKRHLIDSTRAARDSASRVAAGGRGGDIAVSGAGAAVEAGVAVARVGAPTMTPAGAGGGRGGGSPITTVLDFVPLSEMADYYPPIRAGAASPDVAGNVWVLTTTSAASKDGELVYDVVNNKGELFQRVRLPVGRSLAGFGRDGMVYLASGTRASGFTIERYRWLGTTGSATRQ